MSSCHLSQKELARRWKISPRTLEAWRWRRIGPDYIRVVGRILYRIEDVEAFERSNVTKMEDTRGGSLK